jgi:hypothetical protein
MLTPLEIVEQLTVDEFIAMCQALGPIHKFDIEAVHRKLNVITVVISSDVVDVFEVDLWHNSA